MTWHTLHLRQLKTKSISKRIAKAPNPVPNVAMVLGVVSSLPSVQANFFPIIVRDQNKNKI